VTRRSLEFVLVSAVMMVLLSTAMIPEAVAKKGDGIIDPGEDAIAELALATNIWGNNVNLFTTQPFIN